jgi:predicted DNA-binding transcriptional regulator AlpA
MKRHPGARHLRFFMFTRPHMNKVTEKGVEVIRVPALAKALGVHPQTIRTRVKDGSLPKQRRHGRMAPYWLKADLAAVIGDTDKRVA